MAYSYVHEPENELLSFFGYYGKQSLHRFPILNETSESKRFLDLFQMAFYQPYIIADSTSNRLLRMWAGITPQRVERELNSLGINASRKMNSLFVLAHMMPKQLGNRNNRVVKTTHSILAAPFLLQHFQDVKPLFLVRHPAAVVSNLLQGNNADIDRKLYKQETIQSDFPSLAQINFEKQTPEFRGGLQVALFYQQIETLLHQYPDANLVTFEDLAADPFQTSYDLFQSLEMEWTEKAELHIANSRRKKSGVETRLETKRQAIKWKKELSETQIEQIQLGYSAIGPLRFYSEFQV